MTGAGANAASRGEIQPTMSVSRTYASLPTSPLAIAGHPASAEAVAIASTLATDISNTTVAIKTTTDKSTMVADCVCA